MFGAVYFGQGALATIGGLIVGIIPPEDITPVSSGTAGFAGLLGGVVYGQIYFGQSAGVILPPVPLNPNIIPLPSGRVVNLSPEFGATSMARRPNVFPSARIRSIKLTVDADNARVVPLKSLPPKVNTAWRPR